MEAQILYPAFLAATRDTDNHHEAIVAHDRAKKLIAQIEASDRTDEYFVAKVRVLSEMIKHYVKQGEQTGGMVAEARAAKKLDLQEALGQALFDRRQQQMQQLE